MILSWPLLTYPTRILVIWWTSQVYCEEIQDPNRYLSKDCKPWVVDRLKILVTEAWYIRTPSLIHLLVQKLIVVSSLTRQTTPMFEPNTKTPPNTRRTRGAFIVVSQQGTFLQIFMLEDTKPKTIIIMYNPPACFSKHSLIHKLCFLDTLSHQRF